MTAEPVRVELLAFDGCPHRAAAIELVERVVAEVGTPVALEVVDVWSPEDAERRRFLGSPSVRVAGTDVEPGAAERTDYALACRVYDVDGVPGGLPAERWVRDALAAAR